MASQKHLRRVELAHFQRKNQQQDFDQIMGVINTDVPKAMENEKKKGYKLKCFECIEQKNYYKKKIYNFIIIIFFIFYLYKNKK